MDINKIDIENKIGIDNKIKIDNRIEEDDKINKNNDDKVEKNDIYKRLKEAYEQKLFYPRGTTIDLKKYKELEKCYFVECELFDKSIIDFERKEKKYLKTIYNLNNTIDLLKSKNKSLYKQNLIQKIKNSINHQILINRINKFDNIPKKNSISNDKLKIIRIINDKNIQIPIN